MKIIVNRLQSLQIEKQTRRIIAQYKIIFMTCSQCKCLVTLYGRKPETYFFPLARHAAAAAAVQQQLKRFRRKVLVQQQWCLAERVSVYRPSIGCGGLLCIIQYLRFIFRVFRKNFLVEIRQKSYVFFNTVIRPTLHWRVTRKLHPAHNSNSTCMGLYSGQTPIKTVVLSQKN